ncbi:glycosyltransferase family 39 protein [Collybiopsis luxurians FD-317 M1]|uniref:Dolichyl-phosphate-mannose--protein mannosyltransferase n=1 Tax=Collybiopsis luxurians FD-317 M1 TaxID=944289 RepID=A0A0D0BLT8_9AGAR|nr:glycosyltransferase family 39 protein [Collybiopsis luxurians FD-317 M1]
MNSLWFVETAMHLELPSDVPKVNYHCLPGFFARFLELQQVMWTKNAGLTDRHLFDSRPDAWQRLRRGIVCRLKDHRQINLMGNPLVWWLSTLSVAAYVRVRGLLILREKRGYKDFNNSSIVKYDGLCGFLFVDWALHYGPFFLMSCRPFLHSTSPRSTLLSSSPVWCSIPHRGSEPENEAADCGADYPGNMELFKV